MPETIIEERVPAKANEWRERIAEQARSRESVRRFCKERGLAEHCFYRWRKRLQEEGQISVIFGCDLAAKTSPILATSGAYGAKRGRGAGVVRQLASADATLPRYSTENIELASHEGNTCRRSITAWRALFRSELIVETGWTRSFLTPF